MYCCRAWKAFNEAHPVPATTATPSRIRTRILHSIAIVISSVTGPHHVGSRLALEAAGVPEQRPRRTASQHAPPALPPPSEGVRTVRTAAGPVRTPVALTLRFSAENDGAPHSHLVGWRDRAALHRLERRPLHHGLPSVNGGSRRRPRGAFAAPTAVAGGQRRARALRGRTRQSTRPGFQALLLEGESSAALALPALERRAIYRGSGDGALAHRLPHRLHSSTSP